MDNIWEIDTPFETMFCEQISANMLSTCYVVNACIFPMTNEQPMAEFDVETDQKMMNILIMKSQLSVTPHVGNEVTMQDGSHWKMTEVNDQQNWYDIKTRNI